MRGSAVTLVIVFLKIFLYPVTGVSLVDNKKVSASSLNISNLLNSFQVGYDRRVREVITVNYKTPTK